MQKHCFHLVDPSPWPIAAALSLGCLLGSLAGWFNGFYWSSVLCEISFLTISYISIMWWRDVLRESLYQGHHGKRVQNGILYGMLLFIVSEIMLFVGFFWSFMHGSLSPSIDIGVIWPPNGIEAMNPFGIPFLNTLILLTSGASVTWAHFSVLSGNIHNTKVSLVFTLFLASVFTSLQLYEYLTSSFTISDSLYGSCFYLLTGLHGLHVLVGTIFLGVCLIRGSLGEFRPNHHLGLELASLYWHFVDVVWLILFVIVYYWGS